MNYTKPLIAPSLLAANPLCLMDEIRTVEAAGADLLHIDVMDGHYVPNLTFGPHMVKEIKRVTALPLDVHLMVTEPARVAPWFIDAGADWVSFHPEIEPHPYRLLQYIQSCGVKAGVVLNPGSHWQLVEPLLPVLDFVLLMTVNPGFGGQSFISGVDSKIAPLLLLKPNLLIEIDGGVSAKNAQHLIKQNAHILVAGSSIFGQKTGTALESNSMADYRQAIDTLRGK
ncbi:MAG: ribulose-phosphate 3-epimerase [Candidatus Paracaedibacteraceae bacterium]|nr:ribulose-phosphate 3-epimerase [Candidatus Paracaedibacteraceae bacterium]